MQHRAALPTDWPTDQVANDKNYYELLDVSKDASQDDIRKAFREKARTMHPDVSKDPDAEEKFKAVSEAYETLSDPDKRARYDAVCAGGFSTQNPYARRPAGQGAPTGDAWYGAPFDPFGWATGNPFSGAGAGGYRRSSSTAPFAPEAGVTRRVTITLDAGESRKGTRKTIRFDRLEPCEACGGRGAAHADGIVTCPMCSGTGTVSADVSILGGFAMQMRCPECDGSGKIIRDLCPACAGSGTNVHKATVAVDIPPNSHDGTTLRVKGAGDAGRCGGPTSDLVVDLDVPSDHLTQGQETGFTILGVALSLTLCVVFFNTVLRVLSLLALPLFFVFFMLPMGGRNTRGSFMNRALRRVGFGMMLGIFLFIVFLPFSSCAAHV